MSLLSIYSTVYRYPYHRPITFDTVRHTHTATLLCGVLIYIHPSRPQFSVSINDPLHNTRYLHTYSDTHHRTLSMGLPAIACCYLLLALSQGLPASLPGRAGNLLLLCSLLRHTLHIHSHVTALTFWGTRSLLDAIVHLICRVSTYTKPAQHRLPSQAVGSIDRSTTYPDSHGVQYIVR